MNPVSWSCAACVPMMSEVHSSAQVLNRSS